MHQALLIIDVQPSFTPPQWLIDGIRSLIGTLPSAATAERHDESKTPFQKQLGWHPRAG
jgi:nicotinamidase-related amidase